MTGKKNVPNLRFKEFEDEWSKKKLGDICEIKKGTQVNKTELTDKNKINKYYVLNGGKSCSGYYYDYNSFKDTISISEGGMSCGYISYNKENFWSGGHCYTLERLKNQFDINCLYYILKRYQKNIMNLRLGSRIFNIQKNDINYFKVLIPSFSEQQKIGKFLSSLENLIEKQEEKVRLLEDQKKALMQKIFSQTIRFKDDEGNEFPKWGEERLGELCNITTGKLDANAMVDNGKYRFYTCSKEFFYTDEFAFDSEALLISGNGNIGYIHYYKGKFNAYQRTYVLDKFTYNINYIKQYLISELPRRIERDKNSGNIPYIKKSTLYDMVILLPSISEQQKISNFLSSFDKLIEKEREILSNQKQLKQGLLQQMFV